MIDENIKKWDELPCALVSNVTKDKSNDITENPSIAKVGKDVGKEVEWCPLCGISGRQSKVRFFQLNFTEAIFMCEEPTCHYPFEKDYKDIYIQRNFHHMKNPEATPVVLSADLQVGGLGELVETPLQKFQNKNSQHEGDFSRALDDLTLEHVLSDETENNVSKDQHDGQERLPNDLQKQESEVKQNEIQVGDSQEQQNEMKTEDSHDQQIGVENCAHETPRNAPVPPEVPKVPEVPEVPSQSREPRLAPRDPRLAPRIPRPHQRITPEEVYKMMEEQRLMRARKLAEDEVEELLDGISLDNIQKSSSESENELESQVKPRKGEFDRFVFMTKAPAVVGNKVRRKRSRTVFKSRKRRNYRKKNNVSCNTAMNDNNICDTNSVDDGVASKAVNVSNSGIVDLEMSGEQGDLDPECSNANNISKITCNIDSLQEIEFTTSLDISEPDPRQGNVQNSCDHPHLHSSSPEVMLSTNLTPSETANKSVSLDLLEISSKEETELLCLPLSSTKQLIEETKLCGANSTVSNIDDELESFFSSLNEIDQPRKDENPEILEEIDKFVCSLLTE